MVINISSETAGFKSEIEKIQSAIVDFESGGKSNIAVISEPFALRNSLLDRIGELKSIPRLSFSSVVKNKEALTLTLPEDSKKIAIIENCQYLYMRRIGGFDIIENFLKLAASSSNLFITTWNAYSWSYLDEVMNISQFFPVQISPPRLTKNEIKELILSEYNQDEIKFIEDIEHEKQKVINFVKYPLAIKPLKKIINFPFLKIDFSYLKVRLSGKEEKLRAEDIIFDKICHISNGNYGVAKVMWQKSLEYPAIKLSKLEAFSSRIELDYTESFILTVLLSMESIQKDELAEIAGTEKQIDKILFRLIKQGLITVDNGSCRIKPEALRSIAEFLKKSRQVW